MVELRANASPTKAFFVRMLTRDITLNDCILDLIDNSIDGAWDQSGAEPTSIAINKDLAKYSIHIEASTKRFAITDNCGGISLSDAENYAFTFGRLVEQETEDFSVGVYGIGMKRAVFKIGEQIVVRSTYRETARKKSAFEVEINVPDWLEDSSPQWDFPMVTIAADADPGVTIEIHELHDDISAQLGDAEHLRSLRRILARDYLLPLMRGLKLFLNGEQVTTEPRTIRTSEAFQPMRDSYVDQGVAVEIFCGMWRVPPDDAEPEEASRIDTESGWYVLCNGRAVLSADRSEVTGWGDPLPRWHSQYGGFIGFLLFSSTDPRLLPMTTTKRSVDTSSGVYRRALARITVPTRSWIDYTNRRKSDLPAARDLERKTEPRELSTLTTMAAVTLPPPKPSTPSGPRIANVNYSVELSRMRALASAFGSRGMSYRDVGLKSFDYAFGELVEEDE